MHRDITSLATLSIALCKVGSLAWEELLPDDCPDRDLILGWLRDGFPLVDVEPPEVQVFTPNYRSALDERDKVEA